MAAFIKIRVIRVKLVRQRGAAVRVPGEQSKRATCGTFIKNAIRSMCYMKHKVRGAGRVQEELLEQCGRQGVGEEAVAKVVQ